MARVGLVGYGRWGENLARVLHQAGVLTAICDSDPERLAAAEKLYPTYPMVSFFEDTDEMFNVLDVERGAVVLAAPPAVNERLARTALTCGLHVLTEKPLALSYTKALALCELADQVERVLMVDHIFAYSPAVNLVWSLVKSGVIGTLKHISLKRADMVAPRAVDVLYDLAVHDLTIVNGLVPGLPARIWARKHQLLDGELADHATLNLEYVEEAWIDTLVVNIEVSWVAPSKVRQGIFIGEEGMIVYDELSPDRKVSVHSRDGEFGEDTFYRLGDVRIPLIKGREPLAALVATFLAECALQGSAPRNRATDTLSIYQILEVAERSSKEMGRCVYI